MHAKTAQLAADDTLFQEGEPKPHDTLKFYYLTDSAVILMDKSTIHSFICKVTKILFILFSSFQNLSLLFLIF